MFTEFESTASSIKGMFKNMDVLREFLETSTIHGLSYISTSRSKVAKAIWFLCVLFSLSAAFFLIWKATAEQEEDPFSTTIAIRPIKELDFPVVSICPPKDTNTALNHGLQKAGESWTEKQKDHLKRAAMKIFIEDPFVDFASGMAAVANKANIRKMCEGSQSVPAFEFDSSELKTNALIGHITSPAGVDGTRIGIVCTQQELVRSSLLVFSRTYLLLL